MAHAPYTRETTLRVMREMSEAISVLRKEEGPPGAPTGERAEAYLRLGHGALTTEDNAAAYLHLNRALALLAAGPEPRAPKTEEALVRARTLLMAAASRIGRIDEAKEHAEAALAMAEVLIVSQPGDEEIAGEAANLHRQLARLAAARGSGPEAEEHRARAETILEGLRARDALAAPGQRALGGPATPAGWEVDAIYEISTEGPRAGVSVRRGNRELRLTMPLDSE